MSLTKAEALELFRSDDLIGIGMEADAVRRRLHPEGVVTYIIDRNINYTKLVDRTQEGLHKNTYCLPTSILPVRRSPAARSRSTWA